MRFLQGWILLGLLAMLGSCSDGDPGRNRATQGAFEKDLYLTVTDGNGVSSTWGPLVTEDGRYYDIRPYVPADGVYEFLVQDKEKTLTFGFDRIRFDTADQVVALQGTRNPDAFKIPLKGPGSYRFLFDTKDVAKPFLTVTASQTLSSVEYKLMLLPSRFTDVPTAVEDLRTQIEALVTDTLGAAALVKSSKGASEEVGDTKTVYYFDTAGDCMLKKVGLILRERKGFVSGAREFTLKVRGPDEAEISQATVDTYQPPAETKLEEEVSFAGTKDFYALKKTYSYSVDLIVPANQSMATIADFYSIYPHFYVNEDQPALSPADPLAPSYGPGFLEKVYVLGTVELAGASEPSMQRKIELTLWFDQPDATAPVVAELSFKMKETSGNFPKDARTRSDAIFKEMNNLDYWVSPNGITKTNFAYGFNPSFCH